MKKIEGYTYLRSIDRWIKENGDIFRVTKNGNIDNSEHGVIGNILAMSGYWWKQLSVYDYAIVDKIWRKVWDK